MKRFLRRWLVAAALAAIATLGLTPSADAAFKIQITVGATVVTIADDADGTGGSGDLVDLSGTEGVISIQGTVDGFFFQLTGGLSKPILGSAPFLAEMDLQVGTMINTNGAPGSVLVELTDTEFVLSPPAGEDYILRSELNVAGANPPVTGQTIVDMRASGTNEFTSPLDVNGTTVVSPGVQVPDNTAFLTFPGTSPFSITLRADYSLAAGQSVSSFDLNAQVTTPAPAGVVLALSALPVFGFGYLRRRKAKVA